MKLEFAAPDGPPRLLWRGLRAVQGGELRCESILLSLQDAAALKPSLAANPKRFGDRQTPAVQGTLFPAPNHRRADCLLPEGVAAIASRIAATLAGY
jgi:hypothetical protein